jgi:hypothetical protein
MPAKVDWPTPHGTNKSSATKNIDTLRNIFESPISRARLHLRTIVSGKYKHLCKEVVSDIGKDLIARMGLLNRREGIGAQA